MRFAVSLLPLFVVSTALAQPDPFKPPEQPAAEPAKKASALRVQFDLTDGSRVIGKLVEPNQTLAVRTHVGSLKVPFAKLERFVLAGDRESMILQWPNGDRLTGFAETDGVEVQTVLGKLTVPLAAVTIVTVHQNGLPVQPVVPPGSFDPGGFK